MTVVGIAEVKVVYDSSAAAAELEADNEAALAGLGDAAAVAGTTAGEELRQGVAEGSEGIETDLADTGALAGTNLRQGVREASGGIEQDLTDTGALAGAGLRTGVKDGTKDLASDLSNVGMVAGTSVREGVKEGSAGIKDDLAKVAEDGGDELEKGLGGGKLSIISNALSGLGVPMKEVSEKAEKMGTAVEKGGLSLDHLASNAGISKDSFLLGAGGIAVVAGAAVDLGLHMQDATTKVANSAQISESAAGTITSAFSGMAGTSEADGAALATAYASVAGQLGSLQGHALTTVEAVKVMSAAQNLAEATSTDLGTATQSLAGVMQAYQVPVKDAAKVSDQLYVASQKTGLGVDGLGSAVVKVRTGLGAMSPPLSQINGLLVDMADHGESGRKGLSLLTTAFSTFVKPASDVAKAQAELKTATDALPPSLTTLAAQYATGKVDAKQLESATESMSGSQTAAWAAFIKASTGMTTAKQAADALGFSTVNAQGKFIGIGPVLGKLHDQIKGMSNEQATAKLTADGFGSSASKLLTIVQAGPAAFDKATDAVTRHGTAAAAAAKQQEDMGAKAKILETDVEDLGEDLGAVLLPALGDVASAGVDVAKFLQNTPPLAYALGAAVGIGLAVPVARFATNTAKDFVGGLESMGKGVVSTGAKMLGLDAPFAATQTEAEQTASTLSAAASSMAASAGRIEAALTPVGSSAEAMAGEVEGATAEANAALESTGAAAGEMAGEVEAGMAAAVAAVSTNDATIEAENEAAGSSFADLIPGVGIIAGIAGLAGAFLSLGGNETSEASAAQAVTKAKAGEATAVQNATNATIGAGNAYFAVKNAQQQVTTSQQALSAATKKYGADSTAAKAADLQLRDSKFQLTAANTQLTEANQKTGASNQQAISDAQKQVDSTNQQIAVTKQRIQALNDVTTSGARDGAAMEDQRARAAALRDATSQLAAQEQARTQALGTLASAQSVAAANSLILQHQDQTGISLTAQQASKVQGLSAVYKDLPKDVQTKIAGDNTDALEKISTLVGQLHQVGIGTPTIAKILGDTSNAQAAISQLTGLLNKLPPEFREEGQQASAGLAIGLRDGIGGVQSAASALSNAATVTAKDTLKSHSPSQVFHDIGTDVGAGLSTGIDASTPTVKASIKRMLDTITVGDKTYTVPIQPAPGASTPTLEGAGTRGALRAARAAPSPEMAAAEQAWVTGAQTVVTNLTNTAQHMAAVVSSTQQQVAAGQSAAQSKASSDQSKAASDASAAASDARSAAEDTKQAAEKGVSATEKAMDLASAKHQQAAAKVAEGGEAHEKAAAKIVVAAEVVAKAGEMAGVQVARSAERTDSAREAIASKGETSLNTMISAITSGNQQQLTTAMSGITEKQMTALVGKLDATHQKALEGMAGKIETTWKQGMDALALANQEAANTAAGTAITDAAASTAKLLADQQAVTDDSTVGATSQQTQLDQDTLSTDTTIGGDQATLDKAAPGSLAQSQAQLQLAKDTAAQTVLLAKDNAALAALTAATTAATAATTAATVATTTAAAATPSSAGNVTYQLFISGSGQMTTADLMNEIGIAMTVGTLPSAVPNASLPGNGVLVA
jgi:hypothetical protein